MALVAPVGGEQPEAPVAPGGLRGARDVGGHVARAADEALPAGGPRAGDVGETQPREPPELVLEVVVRLVAPGAGDGIAGERVDRVGVPQRDVGPVPHALAARAGALVDRVQEVHVHAPEPACRHVVARAALAQVDGLVEPDV